MNNGEKKIIFFGYGHIAELTLLRLLKEGYQVKLLFTHNFEDNISLIQTGSNYGIKVLFDDLRKTFSMDMIIKESRIDYLISVNYRFILPKRIISLAKYPLNIHGSLLPKYRGRTPHIWAIINGESEIGITSHLINENLDEGEIIIQKRLQITSKMSGYDLIEEFKRHYPDIVIDSINHLAENKTLISQDSKSATFFGKRTPEMGYIDSKKYSKDVINFIRAIKPPYPGAYFYNNSGKKIIVEEVVVFDGLNENLVPGKIFESEGIYYLDCIDLRLKVVKYEVSIK